MPCAAAPGSSRRPRNTETGEPTATNADCGGAGQDLGEVGPVEPIRGALEARRVGGPDGPARMRHFVLERAAVALPRVAPVVLGDELGFRAGDERLRRAGDAGADGKAAAAMLPAVRHRAAGARIEVNRVSHAHGEVGLVVEPSRHGGDRAARHQLADEHDGAAHAAVLGDATHVEAQVHLVEAAMAGDRHAGEPRVLEAEADEADQRLPEPRIEGGAGGHERRQERRRAGVVEEHEVLPAGGEEGAPRRGRHVHAR